MLLCASHHEPHPIQFMFCKQYKVHTDLCNIRSDHNSKMQNILFKTTNTLENGRNII